MNFKHLLATIKYNKFVALIIIFQVALSMSIVSNSFFLTLKTYKEWSLPTGLDTEELVLITAKNYRNNMDFRELLTDDLAEFKDIDGVISVTPMNHTPIAAGWPNTVFEGQGDNRRSFQTHVFDVDANGLSVFGLALIEGRKFEATDVIYGDDQGNAAVVMVSSEMAKALYPDDSAIGKSIWLEAESSSAEIIGVYSGFLGSQFLVRKGMPYRSMLHPKVSWHNDNIQQYMIRIQEGAKGAIFNKIDEYYGQAAGRFASKPVTLGDIKVKVFYERLSTLVMYLTISILLLLITFCGLIGLISFIVSTRHTQIGIRRALGAKRSDILWEFISENILVTIVGVIFGTVLAILISTMFREFNGITAADWIYVVFVGLAILILNVFAVFIPVRKVIYTRLGTVMR